MSILRYICTSFLKWNLVFIMFIVIWYKNHSHLLGKWASVLLPSCSFCLLSKTPTGERLNCSNNDSFHSSLFTWYSLLFVCTAHTPQPELHFRFLAYLHMHTWIFKEECCVFRLERMPSYIMQLLANCICTTGKDFPPRRAHHPFVPRSRVSPDNSSLRALSTVQRGSPLEVLFFFSTLSKSHPWCFCNSTLAVVLCSLGYDMVKTPAAWNQISPVYSGCRGCVNITFIMGWLAGHFENTDQAPSSMPGIDLQIPIHFVPLNSCFSPGI